MAFMVIYIRVEEQIMNQVTTKLFMRIWSMVRS